MKKVQIGDCTLVHGDCMELLESLEPGSVHLSWSDPPYGIGYLGNKRKILPKQGMLVGDDKPRPECVPLIVRAVKNSGAVYLCTRFDVAQPWIEALTDAGAQVKTPIYWIKNQHGMGDCFGDRANCVEIVLFAHVGRHHLRGKRDANAWAISRPEAILHPTPKPIELVRRCILASSDPGDLILDPFLGSGTTAIACLHTGRRFIGCEIAPEYFDLACTRIEKTYREVASRLPGFQPRDLERQGALFA